MKFFVLPIAVCEDSMGFFFHCETKLNGKYDI